MAIITMGLGPITVTTAVSGQTTSIGAVPAGATHLTLHSNFVYGSGGTSAKFYLQMSADEGTTWYDIASLAHTTSSLRRVAGINLVAAGAIATVSDGALTDNTKLDGISGGLLRLKRTTVGTYASTTFTLTIVAS